jgi:hypothetical protein
MPRFLKLSHFIQPVGLYFRASNPGTWDWLGVPGPAATMVVPGARFAPFAPRNSHSQLRHDIHFSAMYEFSVPQPIALFAYGPPLSSRTLLRHSSFVRAVCVEALVRISAGGDQRWSSLPRQVFVSLIARRQLSFELRRASEFFFDFARVNRKRVRRWRNTQTSGASSLLRVLDE